jgi:hypothetical protein
VIKKDLRLHLNTAGAISMRLFLPIYRNWRWLKQGPIYFKVGGRVLYRLEDIEAYELVQITNTPVHGGSK